nr:aminotransferase class V-fold PLP-dependent enzyme [Actinomycetota bacterium]
MSEVDPRLVAAVRRQLAARPAGAERVGWKVGSGDGERIGGEIAVGHLTSATVLEDGATYRGGDGRHADAELAVEIGDDGRAARFGAAVELVEALDMGAVREHELLLTDYALRTLQERHGDDLVVYGPKELHERGGVIAFSYKDIHPHDLSQVLD